MTNTTKTVQYPKLILVRCRSGERMSELIADALRSCSFRVSIDDFAVNTDYIILSRCGVPTVKGYVSDTALIDDACQGLAELSSFRRIVAPYEAGIAESDTLPDVITYSVEHYSADVACRHLDVQGDTAGFDVVSAGILSRARIHTALFSVEEVLACTSVLMAVGVPLASVLGYFNR